MAKTSPLPDLAQYSVNAGVSDLRIHDLRRTAVRNMRHAGVPQIRPHEDFRSQDRFHGAPGTWTATASRQERIIQEEIQSGPDEVLDHALAALREESNGAQATTASRHRKKLYDLLT
jgi:phage I-like protein